ncbi:peptidylprolyl isomerase [Tuwongella immobilis]|uniref:PpiC domain-containing protein n=1 Tax=Tuwongella immobilis TaxID=692036 RepID=A0A6C2YM91_9BACT|nr:peptidylprolyl isomerase [Tuwongella immobilis]VIP02477.1 -type peptidyl-prolyl cis-trans isomerase : Peptidylprolyl isomerase OS=uncultured planctomycete GN=HGMM_F12C05C36 PE=4 SV=1: Rotamase [Tuwongella immobilis]VTS01517.1 -type peptidyl-prolyl cis-trans isomerase : Peptidylprolyl isomerase OS=uncultured planctomycete GN=HGMM_F12C05C36 PE=4 SV=1: Rotamase [Tuwongella immobilis]
MKILHTFGPAVLGLMSFGSTFAQAPMPATSPAPAPATAPMPDGRSTVRIPEMPAPVRPEGNAATVNGKPITEAAVQRSLRTIPPSEHAKARPEIINFLIDNSLIDQYLVATKVAVDPAEVTKLMDEFQKELKNAGTDVSKALQNLMLTEDELKSLIEAQIRWDKFLDGQATEEKLSKFFDANKDIFDGTMVRARHILLTPDLKDAQASAKAQEELQTIKQAIEKSVADELAKLPADTDGIAKDQARCKKIDEAFAAMAREKSSCPSKRDGGDVNWFPRAGSMVESFAKAAFALKPYQMSEVTASPFGYHLILTTARKDGQPTKFADVKNEVKEVYGQRLKEAMVAQLRQRATISVNPAPAVPASPMAPAAPAAPAAPTPGQ